MIVVFNLDGKEYHFRQPVFGNGDEIAFQRVNRRSRGGDLILFRDNEWPKTETLNLTFDFLNEADADRLLTLVKDSCGIYLYYRDHENKVWYGFIKNPDTGKTQQGRNSFQVPIIFEGDMV